MKSIPRQRLFVAECVIDLNGNEAAVRFLYRATTSTNE